MALPRGPKSLLLASLFASMLAGACVFGGDSEPEPTPEPSQPSRPAIGRSGPSPTATVAGQPTPRPTLPPPPTAVPLRDGLVSIVYSHPFIWPAEGPITSFMGPEHPNGIDIGLDTSASLSVRASAGGQVTAAGGSDDDALGISVTIDHGNGVTTTYGHLSALRVSEGDTVESGEVIGIGGSTGISTGNHLHFEVRKDGDTVDPLHILPSAGSETASLDVDCATTPFTLPSGSEALISFESVLADGEELVSVVATPQNGGPNLVTAIENANAVRLQSAIDFDGPNGVDSYDLEVRIDRASDNNVLVCDFVVMRENVPTTFYVRAAPPATDVDEGEDAEEDGEAEREADEEDATGTAEAGSPEGEGSPVPPAPTPTPTPKPFADTPNYQVPTPEPFTGGGPQTPAYGAPGSSGAGAQSPSYGSPGQ